MRKWIRRGASLQSLVMASVGCMENTKDEETASHEQMLVGQSASEINANCGGDASGLSQVPWAMRGWCPTHVGRATLVGSKRDSINWRYDTDRDIRTQPAVDIDGTVYFGSDLDKLHALKANGTPKWAFSAGGDVKSSPAIGANGLIYFGADDERVYAITRTGTLSKSYKTGGDIRSSPVIGLDGTVYVGSDDNRLYAFRSDLTVRWKYPTWGDVASSPALDAHGRVFFGSDDGKVYALDAASGALIWKFDTGGPVRSSPTIAKGGTVLIGSDDDKLYALDASTGARRWAFDTHLDVQSSAAVGADGTIFVGADTNKLYALVDEGATFRIKWEAEFSGDVKSSPTVDAANTVYVGADDGRVRAFSGDTGAPLWSVQTGFFVRSSPVIAPDGAILIGSDDDHLYSIGKFDNQLDLVSAIRVDPDRGSVAEPSLEPDGTTVNPEGLRAVIVTFSQPISAASFSLAENVEVFVDSAVDEAVVQKPDPASFFTGYTLAPDGRSLELLIDPDMPKHGATYKFSIKTEGLRTAASPSLEIGVDARSEVESVRVTVQRPDEDPPHVVSVSPGAGASDVPPHAELRMIFSELMDVVPVDVTAGTATGASAAGLRLVQDVERTSSGELRTFLGTFPGQALLVDANYEVTIDGSRTRDVSGEHLTPGSFVWSFHTAPLRISAPAPGQRLTGSSATVSGVVSQAVTGTITIELRDPSGAVLAGPVVASRASTASQEGGVNVVEFTGVLPLPTNIPTASVIFASINGHPDSIPVQDEFSPAVNTAPPTPLDNDPVCESGNPNCADLPSPAAPTAEDPMVTRRDNPSYQGEMRLVADESVVDNLNKYEPHDYGFSPAGRMFTRLAMLRDTGEGTNLSVGTFETVGATFNLGGPPMLPGETESGPGLRAWEVRGTRLLHDSLFWAWPSMSRFLFDDFVVGTYANSALPIRLSEETLLVPVVIVSWWGTLGSLEEEAKQNLNAWRELLDFVPDHWMDDMQVRTGQEPGRAARETPPDMIWSACGIQFQVIEAFTARANNNENCSTTHTSVLHTLEGNKTSEGFMLDAVDAEKAAALQTLKPLVLSLARTQCPDQAYVGELGFAGKDEGGQMVFVDTADDGPRKVLTAHELGHKFFSGIHCEPRAECEARKELMSEHIQDDFVTISFCENARVAASAYDTRYREYATRFGAELQERVCCDVGDGPVVMPWLTCSQGAGRTPPPSDCREVPVPPSGGGGSGGGGGLPDNELECCFLGGEPVNVDVDTCVPSGGTLLPASECDGILR